MKDLYESLFGGSGEPVMRRLGDEDFDSERYYDREDSAEFRQQLDETIGRRSSRQRGIPRDVE